MSRPYEIGSVLPWKVKFFVNDTLVVILDTKTEEKKNLTVFHENVSTSNHTISKLSIKNKKNDHQHTPKSQHKWILVFTDSRNDIDPIYISALFH